MLTHDDVQLQTQSEHYVNFMSSESQKYFLFMWALCFRFVFVNFTMQLVQAIKFCHFFIFIITNIIATGRFEWGLICSVIIHVIIIKENHESQISLITNHLGVINSVKYPNNAELKAVNSQSDQRIFLYLTDFCHFFFSNIRLTVRKTGKLKMLQYFLSHHQQAKSKLLR